MLNQAEVWLFLMEKKRKKKLYDVEGSVHFLQFFKRVIFQGLNDIIASLKRETKQKLYLFQSVTTFGLLVITKMIPPPV